MRMGCENCNHCKEFKMCKRVIDTHPLYYHKEENSSVRLEDRKVFTVWVKPDWEHKEMESIWLCEIDHCEHMDDDCCANYDGEGTED